MPGCSSCIFYARGPRFDVDRFLERTSLIPGHVWRKGDGGFRKPSRPSSGFSIYVGKADRRFSWHVARALRFLHENAADLKRLRRVHAAPRLGLEFWYYRRTEGFQTDVLPSELLRLAGSLGVDIEWVLHPTLKEFEDILGEKIPRHPPAWARRVSKQQRESTRTTANQARQATPGDRLRVRRTAG